MDASEIPDPSNAIRVSKLLGVEPQDLADSLTTKTIFAQGDSVVSCKYGFYVWMVNSQLLLFEIDW